MLYAISFVIVRQLAPDVGSVASALFLTLVGILSTVAITALWARFRDVAAELALWAYVMGVVGAIGSAIHGSFDLADAIHPSSILAAAARADVPSEIDPRGFLAFFVTALALLAFSWLIVRTQRLPRTLGLIGYASATLLVFLYLARLIILTPTHPLVAALVILNGFFLTPMWLIGLGLALWRGVTRVID